VPSSRTDAAAYWDRLLVLDPSRPEVLLTYGGHPASLELMRRARLRGIAVVFHRHNFGYTDRRAFADASTIVYPSEYSRRPTSVTVAASCGIDVLSQ